MPEKEPPFPADLYPQLHAINRARQAGTPDLELENWAAEAFGAAHRLAIYGSLAPGQSNHAVVSGIPGEWLDGLHVRGRRFELGWGDDMGYPGFTWIPGGDPVAIHLLKSEQLPRHWSRLDAFEGPQYQRILVPVFLDQAFLTLANIYQAREEDSV